MKNCPYCNSTNIQSDIIVDQGTTSPGSVGLQYQTKFLITGVEPFYADLCKDCRSIIRFYIKEVNRNWRVKK